VLPHQSLHALLAHADALSVKFRPDARPAICSAVRGVYSADMHDESLRSQMPTPEDMQATKEVLVVAGHTDSKHAALYPNRPQTAVAKANTVPIFVPTLFQNES
jgi:hypothetical protein